MKRYYRKTLLDLRHLCLKVGFDIPDGGIGISWLVSKGSISIDFFVLWAWVIIDIRK